MSYANNVISTKDEHITSGFRPKNRPDHYGVDIVDKKLLCNTPKGVEIIAIADGVVADSAIGGVFRGDLVGVTVALQHEGKILTRYQHMREGLFVKNGDRVKKGQRLGIMGNTGFVISSNMAVPAEFRGTHLHFAVKENSTAYSNGAWVNPVPYLDGTKTIKPAPSQAATPPAQSPIVVAPAIPFKAGETVRIRVTAQRWINGQIIPNRVKGEKYTIHQVGREMVLLGGINSWIYESDVERV